MNAAEWARRYQREILNEAPLGPEGNLCNSYEVAYQLWEQAFGMYNWFLVLRAIRCWARIKSWLSNNFPEALHTLNMGVSEQELNEAENRMGVSIPRPCRVMYRLCNGQQLPPESLLGIIGGYTVYRHVVSVYLVPLRSMRCEDNHILVAQSDPRNNFIRMADSEPVYHKTFWLNSEDGQLHAKMYDGDMVPCAGGNVEKQSMLSWLEQLYHRLGVGDLRMRSTQPNARGISLFPQGLAGTTTSISHSVQVRASAIFMPECSSKGGPYVYGYSVRMRLLNGAPFRYCQLKSRFWQRFQNGALVESASGDGVAGHFPSLEQGGDEFFYQSRAHLQGDPESGDPQPGRLDGTLTFVPGSLEHPQGPEFEVDVIIRFEMPPAYIF